MGGRRRNHRRRIGRRLRRHRRRCERGITNSARRVVVSTREKEKETERERESDEAGDPDPRLRLESTRLWRSANSRAVTKYSRQYWKPRRLRLDGKGIESVGCVAG